MAKKSPKTKKKTSPKTSAKKTAVKPAKRAPARKASASGAKKLSLNSRFKKVVQIDALDQVLLSMASKRYDQILKQIESGKKRLNEERRLALKLGTRILNKAKKVRDSLISLNKNS